MPNNKLIAELLYNCGYPKLCGHFLYKAVILSTYSYADIQAGTHATFLGEFATL